MPVRPGQRPRFCSESHRKTWHRLRARIGDGPDLEAAIRAWRWEHRPDAAAGRAALLELAEALDGAPSRLPTSHLRTLAEAADDLVAMLDRVDGARWALDGAAGLESLARALDDLAAARPALEAAAALDGLADDLDPVTRALGELARGRDDLEAEAEAPDDDDSEEEDAP